jgi:hypothetical protein
MFYICTPVLYKAVSLQNWLATELLEREEHTASMSAFDVYSREFPKTVCKLA